MNINKFIFKKNIVIFLVIILTINFIFLPLFTLKAKAKDSINKEDVYTGIGVAVLLVIISKIAENNNKVEVKNNYQENDFDYDKIDNEDKEILARAIHAEARGEPFKGQVAVGAVVLNRVKSSSFPNTIEKVVYQDGQFSSVKDGQINLLPNENAYKAAQEALEGNDPSKGALFFYNPKTAKTIWWLGTRQKLTTIGNHVFAK
ncbi:MAG: cell wall hydrolase [Bacillota bacterium]